MSIGVCYFPEHWSREHWERDIVEMSEIGIEYIRMGEFAWSLLQPERGRYEFDWLAEAVDLIDEHGMKAVLCTPTATPPKWLVDEYPDIRQKTADGTDRAFGSRRHYCYNSDRYRQESRRLIRAFADRFSGYQAVAGWQTDNEFGGYGTARCYCEECASAFRAWLRGKYGDVRTLNERWGTAFWSQEHTAFREIDPPRHTPADHHPSRLLDYYRFTSDSIVEYNRMQADLLEGIDDDWFVTHNFMGDFDPLNARDMSADLDFAAWDSYPTLHAQKAGKNDPAVGGVDSELDQRAGDPDVTALNHAVYRVASDRPFWVMEHQSGDIRGFPYSAEPEEGMIRLWSHASVAHGAGTVSYFRWRRCRFGQEKYWGALHTVDGSPDRGIPEVTETVRDLETLPQLGEVAAAVALVHDYDSLWASNIEPHSPTFDYWTHLRTYFRALRRRGLTVDVVGPMADLSGYEAVVAPSLYLVEDEQADWLTAFVSDGGKLLVGARSAYEDTTGRLHDAAPGPLAHLLDVGIEQHESLAPAAKTRVAYHGFVEDSNDGVYDFRVWGEWLTTEDGTIVAEHRSGPGAGEPAAVHTDTGTGSVTYVGVWPGEELADALVTDLLETAGVPYTERPPPRVRLAQRGDLTWVLNHSDIPVRIDAPTDVEFHIGDAIVPDYDLAVLEIPAAEVTVTRV